MENEEPLSGGRITHGVVKAGETVRRPTTPASPFVAHLLGHLQRQGFTGAPRHLGIDEAGRDVLSYVPGRVPARFQRWSDLQVAAAGALLRALHDATRASHLAGQHPVICHHDPGPNNAVFQDEVPVALIDWDTAAPGEPLEDLGYMAWTWAVSSRADAPPAAAQALQVRVLADAYGLGRADELPREGVVLGVVLVAGRVVAGQGAEQDGIGRLCHQHLQGPLRGVLEGGRVQAQADLVQVSQFAYLEAVLESAGGVGPRELSKGRVAALQHLHGQVVEDVHHVRAGPQGQRGHLARVSAQLLEHVLGAVVAVVPGRPVQPGHRAAVHVQGAALTVQPGRVVGGRAAQLAGDITLMAMVDNVHGSLAPVGQDTRVPI